MNGYDGYLIAVEGIDGSGTTTVASALADHLDATLTKEPTDGDIGQLLRNSLKGERDSNAMSEFHLFLADRAEHIRNKIIPALEAGDVVVTDRYAPSTVAYQSTRLADDGWCADWMEAKQHTATHIDEWVVQPDLAIYLDVDSEVAQTRIDSPDTYESSVQFQQQVNGIYRMWFNENAHVNAIDANIPEDKVVEQAKDLVDVYYGEYKLQRSNGVNINNV